MYRAQWQGGLGTGLLLFRLCLVLLACSSLRFVKAISENDLFEFTSGERGGAKCLEANDDGSLPIALAPDTVNVFGKAATRLWVNNNGDITFDIALSAYTPKFFPISGSGRLIAPFWADVDTRGPGSGLTCSRFSTNGVELQKATDDISAAFPALARSPQGIRLSRILIATWNRVGYFEKRTDKTNTFQAVLAWQGNITFTCFYYPEGRLKWVTGEASGGKDGFDGVAAKAGFNAGDGVKFFNMPGSGSNTIKDILPRDTNMGQPGKWCFRLDQGGVVPQVPANLTLRGPPGGNSVTEVEAYVGPSTATSAVLQAGAVSPSTSCGGIEYQWDLNYSPTARTFTVDATGQTVEVTSRDGVRTVGVRASDECGTSAVASTLVVLGGQNLLTNGGFETPALVTGAGTAATVAQDQGAAISGWAVTSGVVIRESTAVTAAADGVLSLNLNGATTSGSAISQAFATQPRCVHVISFAMAGNPACAPGVKTLEVAAIGVNATRRTFTFNATGQSRTALVYERHAMTFTADSERTSVTFTSRTAAAASCGPIIDDVAAYASSTCEEQDVTATVTPVVNPYFGTRSGPRVAIVPSGDDAERPTLASSQTVLVTLDFGVPVRELDPRRIQLKNAAIVRLDRGDSAAEYRLVLAVSPVGATAVIQALPGAARTQSGTPTPASNKAHITTYERNDRLVASVQTLVGIYTASIAGGLALNVLASGLTTALTHGAGSAVNSFSHMAFLAGTTHLAAPYHPLYYQTVEQLQFFLFNTPVPALDDAIWPMETPRNSTTAVNVTSGTQRTEDYVYHKVHGSAALVWRRLSRVSLWFLLSLLATILLHWTLSRLLEARQKRVIAWLLFPRPELLVCLLAVTGVAMTGGLAINDGGVGTFFVGVLFLIAVTVFVLFCNSWVALHVFQLESVMYSLECDPLQARQDCQSTLAKRFWYRLLGRKYAAQWKPANESREMYLVGKWGLLFEDLKGPVLCLRNEDGVIDEKALAHDASNGNLGLEETSEFERIDLEDASESLKNEEGLYMAPVIQPPPSSQSLPTVLSSPQLSTSAQTKGALTDVKRSYKAYVKTGKVELRRYHFRLLYGPFDLICRLVSGFLLGAYGNSDSSPVQVALLFLINVFLLSYLLAFRPMALSREQLVENLSKTCDVALLGFSLVLVAIGGPADGSTNKLLSLLMLASVIICVLAHTLTYLYHVVMEAKRLSPKLRACLSKTLSRKPTAGKMGTTTALPNTAPKV